MEKDEFRVLQRIGEDAAYTFKGLHKTADWLETQYKLFLMVPLLFSIISLGFNGELNPFWMKILAILSLGFTIYALVIQSQFSKISAYRQLADRFKSSYDLAESAFIRKDISFEDEIREKLELCKSDLAELPISWIGRWSSKKRINEEMNLTWLKSLKDS